MRQITAHRPPAQPVLSGFSEGNRRFAVFQLENSREFAYNDLEVRWLNQRLTGVFVT
jgi:hypothetical protein